MTSKSDYDSGPDRGNKLSPDRLRGLRGSTYGPAAPSVSVVDDPVARDAALASLRDVPIMPRRRAYWVGKRT